MTLAVPRTRGRIGAQKRPRTARTVGGMTGRLVPMDENVTRIPLRNRAGEVVAHALVDTADAALVSGRWYLSDGYAVQGHWTGKQMRKIGMHRLLLGLASGDGLTVDHIDRDKLNNRRTNLRIATQKVNAQNRSSRRISSSRFRGVSWHQGRRQWRAFVGVDGRMHFLGWFDDELEAARVARDFRLEHMPGAVD